MSVTPTLLTATGSPLFVCTICRTDLRDLGMTEHLTAPVCHPCGVELDRRMARRCQRIFLEGGAWRGARAEAVAILEQMRDEQL